jgi:antirestriction protein ArdC
VRKGEKSTSVFFWKKLITDEEAEAEPKARFVTRAYSVFNADQVDGYEMPVIPALSESERIERAERFFGQIPVNRFEGKIACYSPASDTLRCRRSASSRMPNPSTR